MNFATISISATNKSYISSLVIRIFISETAYIFAMMFFLKPLNHDFLEYFQKVPEKERSFMVKDPVMPVNLKQDVSLKWIYSH